MTVADSPIKCLQLILGSITFVKELGILEFWFHILVQITEKKNPAMLHFIS